jgi:DNA polymerase sliding clamp subunit (PCNA homolog)
MSIDFQSDEIEIGFNVNYIIDVLKTLHDEEIVLHLRDSVSSCTLDAENDSNSKYLIMPMRI